MFLNGQRIMLDETYVNSHRTSYAIKECCKRLYFMEYLSVSCSPTVKIKGYDSYGNVHYFFVARKYCYRHEESISGTLQERIKLFLGDYIVR